MYFRNSKIFFSGNMGQTDHKLRKKCIFKLIHSGILYISKTILCYTVTAITRVINRDMKWSLLYSIDFSLNPCSQSVFQARPISV